MTSELFNFKLEFAHRFDRVKQLLKVILRFVGHSTSSDAFPKKKKRRKNSDGKLHRNGVQNLHMPAKCTFRANVQ
jgi:hypothetical protein